MGGTAQVDYDALAKQFGATTSAPASSGVDYEALAKQYGATSSTAPSTASGNPNLDRFRSEGIGDRLTDVSGALAATKEAGKGVLKYGGAAALGTADMMSKGFTIMGGGIPDMAHPSDIQAASDKYLSPTNSEQKIGYHGAEIGSAVLPLVKPATALASRSLLLGKTPEAAYLSALKASTTLSEAERAQLAATALEEKIPVTKGGLETLNQRISDVNKAISDQIAADPNRPIPVQKAVSALDALKSRFAVQVNPRADLEAIDSAGQEFAQEHLQSGSPMGPQRGTLPAADAQALKQGTYRALGDKAYGELKGASIEAQKALARGLKEEIANQFPELAKLNARDSKLLDLQPVLERAVARIGNHQLIGIGTPITAAAGEAITGSNKAGAVMGLMKAVLDNPAVKSQLAISLSKSGVSPAAALQRVQAYSGLLAAAAARQSTGTSANGASADSGGSSSQ